MQSRSRFNLTLSVPHCFLGDLYVGGVSMTEEEMIEKDMKDFEEAIEEDMKDLDFGLDPDEDE